MAVSPAARLTKLTSLLRQEEQSREAACSALQKSQEDSSQKVDREVAKMQVNEEAEASERPRGGRLQRPQPRTRLLSHTSHVSYAWRPRVAAGHKLGLLPARHGWVSPLQRHQGGQLLIPRAWPLPP